MDDTTFEPCPHCRVPISTEATVCPQCRSGVLVDVRLAEAMADARVRYRLSRALSGLGEGMPSFSALQATLATKGGGLALGVTRAFAQRVIAAAEVEGAAAYMAPADLSVAEAGPRSSRRWIAIGVTAAAVLAAGAWALLLPLAKPPRSKPPSAKSVAAGPVLSPTDIADRGLQATVALHCQNQMGSGFFIDRDLVVTNHHVLCPGVPGIRVRFHDGREVEGTVEASDESLDLALVRAPGLREAPLAPGDAGSLKVGQRLTMVGSPVGMEFTVNQAGVSNLDRQELGVAYIQIDAAVNRGNSGGPLIDEHGQVVGVVTLKRSDAEGIGLAVPINYLHAGSRPLRPAPGPVSPGFERMARRADEESRRMAGELAATGQRPGLVGAAATGNLMVAHILWPTASDPGPQSFTFSLWNGADRVCWFTGEVRAWGRLEGRDGTSPLPPRVKGWLERNGFSSTLYAGQASMRWDDCPSERLNGTIELELEGADSDANRVRFE